MSMVNCKECGKAVSDRARACPDCGRPPEKKKRLSGLVVLLVVLGSVGLVSEVYLAVESGTAAPPSASATRGADRSEKGASPAVLTELETVRTEILFSSTVVNIRSGPGTEHPVVGQLQRGQQVLVPVDRDSWTHVFERSGSNKLLGFVSSRLLSKSAPPAGPPPLTRAQCNRIREDAGMSLQDVINIIGRRYDSDHQACATAFGIYGCQMFYYWEGAEASRIHIRMRSPGNPAGLPEDVVYKSCVNVR